MTSLTDANGATTLAYNNQGLLKSKSSPNGQLFTITYDIEDRPSSVTDANGVTLTQTFDYLNRVLSRTYPDNGLEYFAYNSIGLTSYTSQIGKVWQYGYDAAGRQRSETTPNSENISNTYNAAGDLLTLTDGKNQVTSWATTATGG